MKNTLYVLAAAVFALQAVSARAGELESSFEGAKQEIVRKNAERLAQARKIEEALRVFRLEKKELLDKLAPLGFSVSAEDKGTYAVRKFGPAPREKFWDHRPFLKIVIRHSCEVLTSELGKDKPACSLGDTDVLWYDTAPPLPGRFTEHWATSLLEATTLPELKAKTENYADFESLVATLEDRYSGADKSASAGKMRATPARFQTAGLDDLFRKLPDLRPIFKTKCTLTYDGTFSPQTATADNCAEAKEQVINKCKFWTNSLEQCRQGKITCTNAATGAPVCLDFGAS